MKFGKVLYFLALLFISCQESEEQRLSRLVKEWEGKEIVFPEGCSFTDFNGNECSLPSLNAPYKIIYYADSLGCLSCKLNLGKWANFIREIDSKSGGKVATFFFIHPKFDDLGELGSILDKHAFNYHLCVDTLDMFNTENQFPENDLFHAFLLDKSNRVVAMGNPILNPVVKELYLQIITGTETDVAQAENTQVTISENVFELGTIELGVPIKRRVKITNTGDKTLIIKEVITSCDCVKTQISSHAVPPKESAELLIDFTPDVTGKCFREVYVFCNAENSPLHVQLYGNIENKNIY